MDGSLLLLRDFFFLNLKGKSLILKITVIGEIRIKLHTLFLSLNVLLIYYHLSFE